MEHWYVYYKVPAAEMAAVANRVRAMFNALGAAAPNPRLLQRAEPGKDEVTLMEIYEPVADAAGFAHTLDRAVRASGLAPALVASRRVERFKDL
jgi:hypothetical protein